jgi:hypothetical protein
MEYSFPTTAFPEPEFCDVNMETCQVRSLPPPTPAQSPSPPPLPRSLTSPSPCCWEPPTRCCTLAARRLSLATLRRT